MALDGAWDVDTTHVSASLAWHHDLADGNCPVEGTRRPVASLPSRRLVQWRNAGHLTAHQHEREILDEPITRG